MVDPDGGLLARLDRKDLSMLVVRGGSELYRSDLPGVRPLLELVDRFPGGLAGTTIADRVVGGCAARVFAMLGPDAVFALVGSVRARAVLDAAGIEYRPRRQVLEIRNRAGTDTCPFEQLSRHFTDTAGLIAAMRNRLAELSRRPAG